MSAPDHNYLPRNLRLPPTWPLRSWSQGNRLPETLWYARELERLSVDYLHISAGFGFINSQESPGVWPHDEVGLFCTATRYLGRKTRVRATLLNAVPGFLVDGCSASVGKVGQGPTPSLHAASRRPSASRLSPTAAFRSER